MTPEEIRREALRKAVKKPIKTSTITRHISPGYPASLAKGILDEMVILGLLSVTKERQVYVYTITDKGREAVQ